MNSDVQFCRITDPKKKQIHTHTLSLSLSLYNFYRMKKTSTTENNTVQKSGNKNYTILFRITPLTGSRKTTPEVEKARRARQSQRVE
jgi:hypothetical protein